MPASFAACVPVFMGDANVCLGKCGSVVGAVAGHCDELAVGLLAFDEVHFVLGFGFGEEVVNTGFAARSRRRLEGYRR